MFDLIGMDVKAQRAKQKVTVLFSDTERWTDSEVSRLVAATGNSVCSDPRHPHHLLLPDAPGEGLLRNTLRNKSFELTVITGMDNPDLPWVPEF